MATVNKDFKIKSGLVVEGTNGTINGQDILTKKQSDQDYIIGLIGGSSDSANTPNTVVKRDGDGNFAAGEITADLVGNVTGQVSDISNHDTNDLAEGSTNKYFTNQRAIDANTGLWDEAGSANAAMRQAENYTDQELATEVTNRSNAIATAKSEAISTSESYTDSAISTEVTNRNSAINSAISTEVTNRNSAIATAKSEAISTSESYTDTAITNLNLAGTYDALGSAANALSDANTYTDGKVSDLVNSAPALLDTLGELATALQNNPDVITNIQNVAAGKQDTLTAGEGIYIDGNNVITGRQQSGGGLKFVGNEAAIDRSTVDSWYDANGAAATAQSNAETYAEDVASQAQSAAQSYADTAASNAQSAAQSYADSLASNYDPAGSAATAQSNAESYADNAASTAQSNAISSANSYTDTAIANGLNGYVTETGTETLTNKTLVDPEISGNIKMLDSNGVYEALISLSSNELVLDTDSRNIILSPEGGNVYVQNSGSSDNIVVTQGNLNNAINGANITPATVQINNYRKEEATQQYVGSASTVDVHSIGYPYESAKYLVRVVGWVNGTKHSQMSEILMTVDGNDNIAITEYGTICTDANPLASFSARLDQTGSTRYVLTATTAVNGCEVIAAATMLSWAD